jgi:hypothetical protein
MRADPPEIVIIDADGAAEPLPPDRPARGAGSGARRWGAVLIGALLVFGLGFAVGHGGGYNDGYDAALADSPSRSDSPSSSAPVTSMTSSSGQTMSDRDVGAATASLSSAVDEVPETSVASETGGPVALQTGTDVCGGSIPVGSVTGSLPSPRGIAGSVVAGARGQVFDGADDPVTTPLVGGTPGSDEYAAQLGSSSDRVFATIGSCADPGGARFIEITHDSGGFGARSIEAPVPKGLQVAGLVMGGSTPWASLYGAADDGTGHTQRALLALDGSGKVIDLPAGLVPEAGYRDLVIGMQYPVSRMPISQQIGTTLQVFDVRTGSVVRQLDVYAARHVIGDGYVLWEPRCPTPCEIRRYDIESGDDTVVGTMPTDAVEGLMTWGALSPDGTKIAMVAPAGPVTGSDSTGYQLSGGFSIQVLTVATGDVQIAGGIELSWLEASMAFTPDSRWLLIGVPTRFGGSVLAYDADMNGPYRIATPLESAGGSMPLAMLPPS